MRQIAASLISPTFTLTIGPRGHYNYRSKSTISIKDYLSVYMMMLQEQGAEVDEAEIASMRKTYGLDMPIYAQYFRWIFGFLQGNFGRSFRIPDLGTLSVGD